jgi:hypothetical protein
MKAKVDLVTGEDVNGFVNAVSALGDDVEVLLTDSNKFCVSAKSLLGAVCTIDWKDVYCVCDKDISTLIRPWIV